MKILRIYLKNLNSLRGEHEIDLEDDRIAQSGLFAITGPTGAGKSTILDAITLALYGRAARYGKQVHPEDMMSRHEAECHAEVDFEVAQGRYRAIWQLRRARGKVDGALQPPKRYLHDADGHILASKINEVADLIEDLCGLDYDRFTRSVLLAQGEFAKFLKASDDERAALLESLTRTAIYSDLGRLVHDEVQGRERVLEAAEQALLQIPVLAAEETDQLRESLAADESNLTQLRGTHEQQMALLASARRWHELDILRRRLQTERSSWQERRDTLAPTFERLRRHHDAQPQVADLVRWEEATRVEEAAARSLVDAETASAQAHLAWQRAWETSTGQPFPAGADDAALIPVLGGIESSLTLFAESAKRLAACPSPPPVADVAALRAELTALFDQGGEPTLQDSLQVEQAKGQRIEQLQSGLEERQRVLARQGDACRALVDTATSLDLASDRLVSARRELDLATRLAETREQLVASAHRIASLESHRARLEDGEPCPLCGSTDHPWGGASPPDDLAALETEWREALALRATAGDARNAADREVAALEASARGLTATIDETAAELARLDLRLVSEAADLGISELSPEPVAHLARTTREASLRFRRQLDRLRELRRADEWLRCRDRVEEERTTLRERLAPHGFPSRGDDPDADALRQSITARASAYQHHIARRKEVQATRVAREACRATRTDLAAILTAALAGSGFATIDDLRAAVMPLPEVERITALETDLRDTGRALEVRWQDCLEGLAALRAAGCPEAADLGSLEAAARETEEAIAETRTRLALARQCLAEDAEHRRLHAERTAALISDRAQLALWRQLRHLIGDSTGKKFRTFAQGISLDLMVRHSNRHLARLTARYQLRRAPGTELGLEIEDAYQGGTRRPTASLSGGESFLASLALALALSDLAGRNVRIDSLFIDEGFGSLDAEALEIALCALEGLRQQDKLVGIISHVGLLQERIGTRIAVDKRPDGTSRLEIATP